MKHISVLLNEVLDFLPKNLLQGCVMDLTAGAGGHLFAILEQQKLWKGICLDQDPLARERIATAASQKQLSERVSFFLQNFATPPQGVSPSMNFILADLGVSSFQLDDPERGMSFRSLSHPDFRMDPSSPFDFYDWVKGLSDEQLLKILVEYGEEPKAKILVKGMKTWPREVYKSAKSLADKIAEVLNYKSPSLKHPATRAFQAFRMALNNELAVLDKMLEWAPRYLVPGGRLAVISFHSLEDRIVKNRFRDLEASGPFDILTKRAVVPSQEELNSNPRSRSAKLRCIERKS